MSVAISKTVNAPVAKGSSLGKDAWRRLKGNRLAIISIVIVLFMTLLVIVWPLLTVQEQQVSGSDGEVQRVFAYDYRLIETVTVGENEESKAIDKLHANVKPFTRIQIGGDGGQEKREWFAILGTDHLGRDVFERSIYGGRLSLLVGFFAAIIAVIIGTIIGALSGYFGGFVDNLIMRLVDILLGIPFILLVIVFMAIQENRSIVNLFVALAFISWLTIARIVRGQVLSLKEKEFIMAARVSGSGTGTIIFRHLVPNVIGIVIIYATLLMPQMILTEAFLSFIGLGVSEDEASWGSLVTDGANRLNPVQSFWWQLVFPASFLGLFLLALNFVGDGLRDALDPRGRK